MENTLEQKSKFFAQYYGQKIVIWNTELNIKLKLNILINVVDEKDLLSLTHLNQITDEDAIEIYKMCIRDKAHEKFYKLTTKDFIKQGKNWALSCEYLNKSTFTGVGVCLVGIDYLRSKGYALPFHNLSIQDLIDYKWIVLKDGSQ